MSGHRRQGIDSTAFDSLLTMSNSTIKLVLIFKKNLDFGQPKSLIQMLFSAVPTNQALGCAIVPETSCRAGNSRTFFLSTALLQ
jgi:hypothetical protein